MKTIITRQEAKDQGLKSFYTGELCSFGHDSERYTRQGKCKMCHREHQKAYYYRTGKALSRERDKKYAVKRATPERRAKHRKYSAEYYQTHKAERALAARKREGKIRQADVFPHEKHMIHEIYQHTPKGHHVDHEIPLIHDLVCGLHCIANLQYLPSSANMSKGNKFDPETYAR